jgi:hypothetical protein
VAFVWAAATAARRQTTIDANVILNATQYRQNPYADLEAIFDQKEGQYLRRIAVFPLTRGWKEAAPRQAYDSNNG